MKRITKLLLLLALTLPQLSWGFYAHRLINRAAIYTLPKELLSFFKKYEKDLVQKSIDADRRRYRDTAEAPRHFIDLDQFPPIDSIPKSWAKAKALFAPQFLQEHGLLPWHLEQCMQQLQRAFKDKNRKRIIQLSADIGHYIADAHVPLHTTSNYNGQLTNQLGIHALWESRIPETYAEDYAVFVGKASYISDYSAHIWAFVAESYRLTDSVLFLEKETTKSLPAYARTAYLQRNNQLQFTYSAEFVDLYHRNLEGMVQARMQGAIVCIGSFWMTAWVRAGQPTL